MCFAALLAGPAGAAEGDGETSAAAPHPLTAAFLDDDAVRAAVVSEGRTLVEAGATLPLDAVREQLARPFCALPPPSTDRPVSLPPGAAPARVEAATLVFSCVYYCCDGCGEYDSNCASGFAISADGLAVTNHHVLSIDPEQVEALEGPAGLVAVTRDGRTLPVTEVLAADEAADVALVRLGLPEGETLPFLPLAEAGRVGEAVHCVSHPAGRFFSYSRGVITRRHVLDGRRGRTPRLTVSAEYARGSSGAPVTNARGEVVGLVTTTDSVYYTERRGKQKDLQMVFRDCVPVESLRALFTTLE